MTSLIEIYSKYIQKDDAGRRAAFEASMINRIENEGYKMSDLMYEVFECQMKIAALNAAMDDVLNKLSVKPKSKKR